MKVCPKCGIKGKCLSHSFVRLFNTETGQLDESAHQVLDHVLECPEHGQYEGNFKLNDYPDLPRVKSHFEDMGDTWKEPEAASE